MTRMKKWGAALALWIIVVVCASGGSWAQDQEKPAADSRELLRSFGIDQARLAELADNRPLDDKDTETLLRIMFRLREFPAADIQRWATRPFDPIAVRKEAAANRGQFFTVQGRVTRVQRIEPSPEIAARLELAHYYRCEFLLAAEQPGVLYTEKVPKAWKLDAPVDYRSSALAMFLKFGGAEAERPLPIFLAPRAAWHPATPLGDLGMDVGLLDDVENQRALSGKEFEGFYQMRAAVRRAGRGQLLREARKELEASGKQEFSIVPLFNEAATQHGRLVMLRGVARRVLHVPVEDPDVRARFGIDHYYELSMFTDDSQGHPLIFCVPDLPEGMPVGVGPGYGEEVEVAGFFFKSWSYKAQATADVPDYKRVDGSARRLAPLLIGQQPVWYPRQTPAPDPLAQALIGGLFVVAVAAVWFLVWRHNRQDRQFREKYLRP